MYSRDSLKIVATAGCRSLAARMKATTVELDAGHLSLVSHAREIAELILAAAGRRHDPLTTRSR